MIIFEKTDMFFSGITQIGTSLKEIRSTLVSTSGIVPEEEEEVFREQIMRSISDKMIRALSKYCKDKQGAEASRNNPLRRTKTNKFYEPSEMSTTTYSKQGSEADGNDELFEEEEEPLSETGNTADRAEEEEEGDQEEEKKEPTDQGVIDAAFMNSLAQNWPLKCYYRTLKTSIQVTLGSEKIPPKLVPQWRKEVFLTFRRLTSLVPEINYTYKMLGLSESNIKGSVADLTNGLSESQKVKLARYIATRLTIK